MVLPCGNLISFLNDPCTLGIRRRGEWRSAMAARAIAEREEALARL